jgi:uroporphyrinogen decarboxylase
MNERLLQALRCQNQGRPPIWLMRQAGRFLPKYQALRQKYSLWQLFHQPELAAEVTLLPFEMLPLDAAILFSDILVIGEALGFKVIYPDGQGPYFEPRLTINSLNQLKIYPVEETLGYVKQTINILKPNLKVPLIGFCGGPFTVASYLLSRTLLQDWVEQSPEALHQLLEQITAVTIDYLKMQIAAGVDAIQIFDSWANLLDDQQFLDYSCQYLKKILNALKPSKIPVILFCRNSSLRPEPLVQLAPTGISFDWHQSMKCLRLQVPAHIAIQGNLNPEILKGSIAEIDQAAEEILSSMKGEAGFIFNLGHGVLPGTPVAHVQYLVEKFINWKPV